MTEEEDTVETAVPTEQYVDALRASCPLFTRPIQRQRWEDTQIHPVVNWGDLFFDLFYVAAAYNLSNIIITDPSSTGLLYFVGCFWAVLYQWLDKMYYDARFYTGDDVWHRCFEVAVLVVLATTVLHIRPVKFLENAYTYNDMFVLSLSCFLANLLTIIRYLEVYFWVDGEEAAKQSARRDIFSKLCPLGFYLAALVVSGVEFYRKGDGARHLAETTDSYGSSSSYSTTNVPIILICCASLATMIWTGVQVTILYPGGGRHKKISVPMNIDFCIHRFGEWTMLMLGESVLSLLIVNVSQDSFEYYITFYAGIISVILLQYVHFISAPAHADEHAMRRSKEAGYTFFILMQFYSAALILLGTSFKMFLYEYTYEEGIDNHRILGERWLAGGEGGLADYEEEDRRRRMAIFFCVSLAVVWFCSDCMILVHKGLRDNMGRCRCKVTHKTRIVAVTLVSCRIALIAFICTLWLYETDPHHLAVIGMCGIIMEIILRAIGNYVFPDDYTKGEDGRHAGDGKHGVDEEENRWPNVTRAQAEHAKADETNTTMREQDEPVSNNEQGSNTKSASQE